MKTIRQIQFLQTIEGTYNNWIKIQGVHEIFDLHSYITFEITITMAIIKHIEEMASCEKVTLLKRKKWAGVIYDNDLITGVDYGDTGYETQDCNDEDQEDKDCTESEIYESEDKHQ